MKKLLSQLNSSRLGGPLRYLVVGGLATLVEWGVFWVCDTPLKIQYLISTAIAFFFSTFANWAFGRLIMFKKPDKSLLSELASIYLTSAGGLLLNLIIMFLLVELASMGEMLAKIAATVLVFAYNYFIRTRFIYKK